MRRAALKHKEVPVMSLPVERGGKIIASACAAGFQHVSLEMAAKNISL